MGDDETPMSSGHIDSVRPVPSDADVPAVSDPESPPRRVEPRTRRAEVPAVGDLPRVTISTSDSTSDGADDDHPTRRTLPGGRFGAVPLVRVDKPSPDTVDTEHPGHARLLTGDDHQIQEGGIMTNDDQPDDGQSELGLSSSGGTDFEAADEAFVLPHWTAPGTGQVPKVVVGDDADEEPTTGSQPRWRDERERSADADFDDLRSDEPQLGALAGQAPSSDPDDFFSGESEDDPFQAFAPTEQDARPARVSRRRREDAEAEKPTRRLGGLGRLGRRTDGEHGDEILADSSVEGAVGGHDGDVVEVVEVEETFDPPAPAFDAASGGGPTGGSSGGSGGGDRNLVTAVAVGLGLTALALVCFRFGGLATTVLACVIVGVAAGEYFNVARSIFGEVRDGRVVPDRYFPTIVGLVGIIGLLIATYTSGLSAYPIVIPIVVVSTLIWYLWVPDAVEHNVLAKVGLTLLGFVWIGVLGSFGTLFLGLGRQMQSADPALTSNPGIGVLIAAILATVASDVGAYFVGRSMGRTPLSDASPNKTVEGLIGGFITSVVVVVIVVGFFGIAPIGGSFPRVFVFALLCALAAPLGDLVESLIKRDVGVKDMGGVLPGHGGVLDRFDGLLFVLPVAYFVTLLFDVWSLS